MGNPNSNSKRAGAPPLATPIKASDDIVARVVATVDKQGGYAMEYTKGNLPLALHLLSQEVEMAAKLLVEEQQVPPRVIPVVGGLPPGVNLK